MSTHDFNAVWPITDPGMHAAALIQEARADLPSIASRHNARITGDPYFQIRAGRHVRGSQGAAYVITCIAPAEPIRRRNYGNPQLERSAD